MSDEETSSHVKAAPDAQGQRSHAARCSVTASELVRLWKKRGQAFSPATPFIMDHNHPMATLDQVEQVIKHYAAISIAASSTVMP